MILHEKISAQLPAWRERIKSLAKEHAEVKVDDVTVGQIVGGMRDIKSMLSDISFVGPAESARRKDAFGGRPVLSAHDWRSARQGRRTGSGSRMGQARHCS